MMTAIDGTAGVVGEDGTIAAATVPTVSLHRASLKKSLRRTLERTALDK